MDGIVDLNRRLPERLGGRLDRFTGPFGRPNLRPRCPRQAKGCRHLLDVAPRDRHHARRGGHLVLGGRLDGVQERWTAGEGAGVECCAVRDGNALGRPVAEYPAGRKLAHARRPR